MPLCLPYTGLAAALGSLSSVALSSAASPPSVAQAGRRLQLVIKTAGATTQRHPLRGPLWPRTRGPFWPRFDILSEQERSTPTRVGKSLADPRIVGMTPVHPHACGEICHRYCSPRRAFGPPPRVWGNLCTCTMCSPCKRSTPTRVGKSWKSPAGVAKIPVHPHACGEIVLLGLVQDLACGPPPRVWGNRRHFGHGAGHDRSTPTRVGKSDHQHGELARLPVHPHACGEIAIKPIGTRGDRGPPPRVWGNR